MTARRIIAARAEARAWRALGALGSPVSRVMDDISGPAAPRPLLRPGGRVVNRSRSVKDLREIWGIRGAALAPLLLTASLPASGAGKPFDPERALAHVRALADTIGPRATGTEG